MDPWILVGVVVILTLIIMISLECDKSEVIPKFLCSIIILIMIWVLVAMIGGLHIKEDVTHIKPYWEDGSQFIEYRDEKHNITKRLGRVVPEDKNVIVYDAPSFLGLEVLTIDKLEIEE